MRLLKLRRRILLIGTLIAFAIREAASDDKSLIDTHIFQGSFIMLTKEELSGTWNDLLGRVKQEWGNISDDDLLQVGGSIDRLVGIVQKKTGAARVEIEKTLRSLSEQSASMLGNASQAVQGATQAVQDYANQASDMAKEQYGRAQDMVRQRPAESVIVSFGTGLLLGVVVGLIFRSK